MRWMTIVKAGTKMKGCLEEGEGGYGGGGIGGRG